MNTTRRFHLMACALGLATAGCPSDSPPGDADGTATGGISATLGSASATEPTTGSTEPGTVTLEGSETATATTELADTSAGTTDPSTGTSSAETTAQTTADPSSSEGSSTSFDVIPCDVAEAVLEPVPPNIMLVLDKSGSMVINAWDHDANGATPEITRWNSLYQVVDFVTTTFDAQINFGAVLFPAINATSTYNINGCITGGTPDIAIAANNSAAILAGIPAAGEANIFGGTPATAGVTVARTHLLAQNPANPRALILVTDGAANCAADAATNFERFEVYDDALPALVATTWTADGIPVYVVGIDVDDVVSGVVVDGSPDSTNTYDALNEVAVAGGQPLPGMEQFYQATNQLELQDALEGIIANALSCTVPLDPEPAFPELLEVLIEAMMVPEVNDCATEDGWVYTNAGGPYDSIELCGSWCDALKDAGTVTAEYYCEPG